MTNLNETEALARTWVRAGRVVIDYAYGKVPVVHYARERLTLIGGKSSVEGAGTLSAEFNPAGRIALVDPATNLPTGQFISEEAVFVALYSHYLALEQAAAQGQAPGQ